MTEQYPSYSAPDESLGAPAPVGAPPRSTALAVKLLYAQAALAVIELIITLAFRNDLRSSLRTASPNLTPSGLDNALTAATIVAVVVNVAFVVLYLLLARQVPKGRNWARIVTVVLAVYAVLFGVSAFYGSGMGLSGVLSVASGTIGVPLIVLLMFSPDSKAFFAARR